MARHRVVKNQHDSVKRIRKKLEKALERGDVALSDEYQRLLALYPPIEELVLERKRLQTYVSEAAAKKVELDRRIKELGRQIAERKVVYGRLVALYNLDAIALPKRYRNRPVFLREGTYQLDIFFSDSNHPFGPAHGHYGVNKRGQVVYRREPGVRQK